MDRIPLAIPNIGPLEAANLQKCVDDNFVSTVGPFVSELEQGLAKLSGTQHAVAMGAGTQALHMSMHAMGIGQGDLVILPSFTFIASANSVAHTGARPWLFDIEPDSWTLDAAQVEAALKSKTTRKADGSLVHTETGERVAAIMPVYTLGTPADMTALNRIAKEYGLPIVADAAAAVGVEYKGQPIGDVADVTCYSFNGNKTITSGGGGMVVTNDEALAKIIRHVSTTARVSKDYLHDRVGYNYRMTNIQAAVGCAQLGRLPGFLKTKRDIRKRYDAAFDTVDGIKGFPSPQDRTSACWFSGFTIEDKALPSAQTICDKLSDKSIEARVFWRPVHMQPPFENAPSETQSRTEGLFERIVTLPCSTSLTPEQQDYVIASVLDIIGGGG